MKCPICGSQHLKIDVTFQGFVTAYFHNAEEYELTEPVSLTSTWNADSSCECVSCGWKGTVADATNQDHPEGEEDELLQ